MTGWFIYRLAFYRVPKYWVTFFRVAFVGWLISWDAFCWGGLFLGGLFPGGFMSEWHITMRLFFRWLLTGGLFPRPIFQHTCALCFLKYSKGSFILPFRFLFIFHKFNRLKTHISFRIAKLPLCLQFDLPCRRFRGITTRAACRSDPV